MSPLQPPLGRNSCLDVCRIFTSIAILWMHTWESGHMGEVGEIGRFGVPFFTICATYLLMQSFYRRPDRPFLAFLKNRFIRLYLPFLAWGSLGLLLMTLKHRFISGKSMPLIGLDFFFDGASFQLWYLPFLLLISVLFFPVCSIGAKLHRLGQYLLAAVMIVASATAVWGPTFNAMDPEDPKVQYHLFLTFSSGALPLAFLGVAIALLLKDRQVARWAGWFLSHPQFSSSRFFRHKIDRARS